jgi:hypothetical protein
VGRYTAILLASLKTPKPIKKLMLGPPLIDCFAQLVLNPRYLDWGFTMVASIRRDFLIPPRIKHCNELEKKSRISVLD